MEKRKLQIGVMGSAADLQYGESLARLAEEVGEEIAKTGAVLMFGAEKDYESLSYRASIGARRAGGLTVGITYGSGMDTYGDADVIIATGLERGGGRELSLVLSCDAIVSISGGSGTLTEIAIAYQANVPVVALAGTGGWSEKLAGVYLDQRERLRISSAKTAKEAVELAVRLGKKEHHKQLEL